MAQAKEQNTLTQEDILNYIDNMKVIELADFVKKIEDRYGVSATMPVSGVAISQLSEQAAPAEEKTSFDVVLSAISADKKIQTIKVLRELTSLGLKEAKQLVEGVPKPVKTDILKEEAETIKTKLEAVGATVEVK